ncbi:MAG: universal stress protein [Hydrogenophaga sp.]|jgi:nucleotide-binding universal stress UspA family protein|uniref:universal stress protein n=1 Tax=Hydrogenophaga sp. TaxID=1904254 RepID=UPI00271A7025|nr:universal stress protein [Hydrogenophaga sp.]MDO9202208.1 universal stress protein [Hydrogenophaga sp.]MDO9481891.1 universal stress protein [Hydrogenophaga sp.]MDP1894277.1 universal stress protein [Hydrogenophaga sp.]MDP2092278.1 universal stress protein [Hydrogenophaga sp.]MDP2219864.1 universal stress protein [Hydrogenophaga sp.]
MKILLAVDGSKYTKKMLAYLATHDEVFSAKNEFTLFTAQIPLPPRARAAVGSDIANGYYADEVEKVTAPVVKFLKRHSIEAQVLSKVGAPGELIAKTAEAGKFDLVMMGSHGHSALGNLVMGSVATQVIAHCKVPVLLVR